mgnify:FL=1
MGAKEFDYYIFIDYSENLLGYMIVENAKLKDLLPKISKFAHYKELRHKSSYINSIKKRIVNNKIKDCLLKLKIKDVKETPEIYVDLVEFIKKYDNCLIFISVDDKQYLNFERLVKNIGGKNNEVVKESKLKRDSREYRLSLVLDTLLNIERLK